MKNNNGYLIRGNRYNSNFLLPFEHNENVPDTQHSTATTTDTGSVHIPSWCHYGNGGCSMSMIESVFIAVVILAGISVGVRLWKM